MREIDELMPMVGEDDALDFLMRVEVPSDDEYMMCRVVKRVKYRFDQCVPVPPRFRKGKYGKKYDAHTCGHCGYTLEAGYKYCPNCGFAIGWANPMKAVNAPTMPTGGTLG